VPKGSPCPILDLVLAEEMPKGYEIVENTSFEKEGKFYDLYMTRNISGKRGISRFRVAPERVCKFNYKNQLPEGKEDYILLNRKSID
jgi:hypothetical protein